MEENVGAVTWSSDISYLIVIKSNKRTYHSGAQKKENKLEGEFY